MTTDNTALIQELQATEEALYLAGVRRSALIKRTVIELTQGPIRETSQETLAQDLREAADTLAGTDAKSADILVRGAKALEQQPTTTVDWGDVLGLFIDADESDMDDAAFRAYFRQVLDNPGEAPAALKNR